MKKARVIAQLIFRTSVSMVLMICLALSCTEWNSASKNLIKRVDTPDTITRLVIIKESNFLRFQVHLIPDTTHAIILEGDETSVGHMEAETEGNKLILKDKNAWGISEGFHNILHFYWHIPPGISFTLLIDGTPINVSSADTLRNSSLVISSSKSFGTINVLVVNNRCTIRQNSGSADFTIKGSTRKLSVTCNGGGPMLMDDLAADEVSVLTEGQNDVYVQCKNQLQATINNIGNVYYTGNPSGITVKGAGPGKLIKITRGD